MDLDQGSDVVKNDAGSSEKDAENDTTNQPSLDLPDSTNGSSEKPDENKEVSNDGQEV